MPRRITLSVYGLSTELKVPEECPNGVTVVDHKKIYYFDAEGLADLNIAFEIARGVAFPILAAWIYDKFIKKDSKHIAKETTINEKVITFATRDEFIQLVQREIEETEE